MLTSEEAYPHASQASVVWHRLGLHKEAEGASWEAFPGEESCHRVDVAYRNHHPVAFPFPEVVAADNP